MYEAILADNRSKREPSQDYCKLGRKDGFTFEADAKF